MSTVFNALGTLLDILMPPRHTAAAIAELTIDDLSALASPDGTLPYRDPKVRALIWEVKYRDNTRAIALAGEHLAELLLAEVSEILGTPILMPMPMHPERRALRGYNQTERLCEAALRSRFLGLEYAPDILVKSRHTPQQQGLMRHKRLRNVKHSMQIKDPTRVRSRVCIVVDDVSTTGASFAEARRALLASGAAAVYCLPLARS